MSFHRDGANTDQPSAMTTQPPDDLPAQENPDVRYERRDVSARGIVLTALGLVLMGVVIHLGAWWIMILLEQRRQASAPAASTWTSEEVPRLPRSPRLEGIQRMEGEESDAESPQPPKSYAMVDESRGIVQIPLDKAMRLIVEHDLLKGELRREARDRSTLTEGRPSRANSGRGRQGSEP